MKPAHRPTNSAGNLMPGGPGYHEGKRQRAVRRLLIAADSRPVTTRQMMEVAHHGRSWPEWRWRDMRKSAIRYIAPLTSSLMWRAKPGVLHRKPNGCRNAPSA
jgi:hypothetical protein